jgi:glycosyltransferase involved in cell wall biosynthesis
MYPDWKLTIIGDGDDRGDLEKRIHEYGLKRVSITGFVNPIKYYKRASILLLTSEYEGFGLVVAEAMSHGVVPVVYNSFESARDLVTDGYNGILVEKPYSTLTFTKVLQELMDKPNYLNELSNNSRIVSADYSIDKIAKEWYQLWNN